MSWGPDHTPRDEAKDALLSFLRTRLQPKDYIKASNLVRDLDNESYSLGYNWAEVEIEAGDGL